METYTDEAAVEKRLKEIEYEGKAIAARHVALKLEWELLITACHRNTQVLEKMRKEEKLSKKQEDQKYSYVNERRNCVIEEMEVDKK